MAEDFSSFDLTPGFGLEMSVAENQSQNKPNLNKRMKTNVRRKTGPARRDDLPWWTDLDSSTRELCQNTSDNKRNKQFRLSLAVYKTYTFTILPFIYLF